jgi:hypothetical protein
MGIIQLMAMTAMAAAKIIIMWGGMGHHIPEKCMTVIAVIKSL